MEAALANLVNQGDKILSLIIGNFGARWANIAASRGAVVEKLEVELGQVITPELLKAKLSQDIKKEIKTKVRSTTIPDAPISPMPTIPITAASPSSMISKKRSAAAVNAIHNPARKSAMFIEVHPHPPLKNEWA